MEHILNLLSFILILPLSWFVIKFGKHLHRNETRYYWIVGTFSVITAIAALVIQIVYTDVKTFTSDYRLVYAVVFQGHFAFAFYTLVMFAGAFKHKSKAKTTLMSVRRELAIIGFFFLVPHVVLLIWLALTNLNPTGTIAFLVMIPLFITSFRKIRKKMHPLAWKKLHKLAYIAYAMVYIHLASITIVFNLMNNDPGTLHYILGFVRFGLYTVIFGFYTFLKFKYYILADKPKPKQA